MKPNALFLAELYVGKCRIATPLPSKLTLSFRIGKNTTYATASALFRNGEADFDSTLQLNTDELALDTQRGSLTLSSGGTNGQGAVLGLALIPLSKEAPHLAKKLRLTQCGDRTAEVDIVLTLTPMDSVLLGENNMAITMRSSGVSSNRSIMEMQEFDRKLISPPRLFTFTEKDNKLLPPKPRSAKELPSPSEDLNRLQNECDCLRQLLRVEVRKSDASDRIIGSLVNALEELKSLPLPFSIPQQLDETLLLEELDQDDQLQKALQRNAQLENEVAGLKIVIEELKAEKIQLLKEQSTRVNSREVLLAIKQPTDNSPLHKLTSQLTNFQQQVSAKFQEMQRHKKKMRLNTRLPALDHPHLQRTAAPLQTLKAMVERILQDNRELTKAVLRLMKQEADMQSDGFLSRLKQRIDRTFGSLIAKKMNRDILIFEKTQLVRALEQLWAKSG